MPTLNGARLPQIAKLSDYLDNTHESVRVTGLRAGQTLEVDVTLDGKYTNPTEPKVAGWRSSVTGYEGVHTPMLAIAQSTGFTVHFTNKSEVQNSRGRGITISNCSDFEAADLWVRGARTAGISLHGSRDLTLVRPVTIDTGNYQTDKGQGPNWPGSIKLDGCRAYRIVESASIAHMGNGLTPTESGDGTWVAPFTYEVYGAQVYINASPEHTVTDGLAIGRAAAYVVQSEEENEGPSENVRFERCYALGGEWGLAFWGNEKKAGVVINNAAFVDGVLISDLGIKFHANANIRAFDRAGTLLIKPSDLPANLLANLRMLSDRVADAYRAHADADAISAARVALGAAFAALREPVEPVEPVDWAALIAEGEERHAATGEWLRRFRLADGTRH